MIVKMKKIYLVVLDSERKTALLKLRDLGVMHVDIERERSGEAANSLLEKKTQFERGLYALSEVKGKTETAKPAQYSFSEAEMLAGRISFIQDRLKQLEEEKEKNRKEILALTPWGDFSPATVRELEQKGITLKFYQLSKAQMSSLPDDIQYIKIKNTKNANYIIVFDVDGTAAGRIPADPFNIPQEGISQLSSDIEKKKAEIAELVKELETFSASKMILGQGLRELEVMHEFESVNAAMGMEDKFAYISGYVPEDEVASVKKEAAAMHWGLLIRDPEDEETPPTLLRNPKWVNMIQPLFRFLDTTPGYRELDISMLFLVFFTVFAAMIIGDAAYGTIFLIMTLFMRMKLRQAPRQVFVLLFVLSFSTIIWGAVTGTWFGSTKLAEIPLLKFMIIPEIASFGPTNTTAMIQDICFVIGLMHLSIGILISFVRKMPSLAAIAELGWLSILFSAFFAARYFTFGVPLNQATLPLFAVGFGLVLLFSEQDGKGLVKGLAMGLVWSPMKFLGSVSMFADLVSYIRLFAVGLATIAVAQSFNTMVSAFEGISGMIFAAVILFCAHTFNMAMSLLATVVHGVRLNMLEFGGKIGMEWSGHAYHPFSKKDI